MPKKDKHGVKRWLILSGIAFQMGIIIYLFVRLGNWLDSNYLPGQKTFTLVGTLLGVGISLYLVVKQTNSLNK